MNLSHYRVHAPCPPQSLTCPLCCLFSRCVWVVKQVTSVWRNVSTRNIIAQMLPDQLSSSSTLCFAHYDKWLQNQCGQLVTIFWWWTLNINISTLHNWYIYKEIVNKIKQTLKAFPCPIERTSSNLESVLFSYWTFLSTSNSFFRKVSSSLISPWYNPSTTLPWQRDLHSFFKQGLTKHCHHHPSVPG